MRVAHLKFVGEQIDREGSTFNSNIQVSRSVGSSRWVGGKSFKSHQKKTGMAQGQKRESYQCTIHRRWCTGGWVLVHSSLHIVKNRTQCPFRSLLGQKISNAPSKRAMLSLVPSATWKNPYGCHWLLPKLNPSLRVQFLFFNSRFLFLKAIFLSKPLDFLNILFFFTKNSLLERICYFLFKINFNKLINFIK